MHRTLLISMWLLTLAACGQAEDEPPVSPADPARDGAPDAAPSQIVLVTVDSLRRDAVGASTPALSRLQRDGTTFLQARSPSPWAKPSIATLSTSLAPERHGAVDESSVLPAAVWTLAEVLQCAGFSTASFYANGFLSDRFGFDQGWDQHSNAIRENQPSHASALLTEAAAWIRARDRAAFFAHVHLIDPHVPYAPPVELMPPEPGPIPPRRTGEWLSRRRGRPVSSTEAAWLRRLYGAEVTAVDRALEGFRATLPPGTLLVLTASDGESLGEEGRWGGQDTSAAREIPLSFVGPGIGRGQTAPIPVGLVDVAPTIVELAGLPPVAHFEGRSLAPLLRPGAAQTAAPRPVQGHAPDYPPVGLPPMTFEVCMQLAALAYLDLGGLSAEAYCRQRASRPTSSRPESAPCAHADAQR